MSSATVVTEGFGSFGDVAHVVTDGFGIGLAPSTPADATILTQAFGALTAASAFIVTEGFRSGTPTPTPTPTGQVGTTGGGGRRKRTLPEYYSRQFFGRQVQLPQDDIAHQVAEQVLEQADGVLEDLADGSDYDELLATVDQLARIVAAQIESRSVYDAIEGVRAVVMAKKDGEIRELMLAAEEEAEVTEIMELL